VINYDLPNVAETYVHRIGRTGRADASGIALSFCDVEERPYLKDIQKLIKQEVPVISDHPYPDDGKREPKPQEQRQSSRPPRRNTSRKKPQRKKEGSPRSNRPKSQSRKPQRSTSVSSKKDDRSYLKLM